MALPFSMGLDPRGERAKTLADGPSKRRAVLRHPIGYPNRPDRCKGDSMARWNHEYRIERINPMRVKVIRIATNQCIHGGTLTDEEARYQMEYDIWWRGEVKRLGLGISV